MSSADPNPAGCSVCSATAPAAAAIRFDPAWRTSTVIALAQGIAQDSAFDVMPILADALEDAGCDNVTLLDHCRYAESHEPACWVLALILSATPPPIFTPPPEPSVLEEALSRLSEWQHHPTERRKITVVFIPFIVAVAIALALATIFPNHQILVFVLTIILMLVIVSAILYLRFYREVLRERRRRSAR